MPDESAARPFEWSEVNELAEKKIDELKKAISAEISNEVKLAPPPGATRRRISELLGERADDWAGRAANTYKESLVLIGREETPGARISVWLNGLRSFIDDDLRRLLLAARVRTPRIRALEVQALAT